MYAHEILTVFNNYITSFYGDVEHTEAGFFDSLSRSTGKSLIWISGRFQDTGHILKASDYAIAICEDGYEPDSEVLDKGGVIFMTRFPRLLAIKVAQRFFSQITPTAIHPTAVIHPDASIGRNCSIGAYAVIGNCSLSDDVCIGAGCVIEDGVEIGRNTSIGAKSVLGSTQSANERDLDGTILAFPHLGKLVIGQNVSIGTGCIIAKGVFEDTRIGDGTVIDSSCLVGHNAIIGKRVFLSSNCTIGGSAVIEDDAVLFSDVKTRQWVRIGRHAVVGQGSLVIRDVPERELWFGSPAKFDRYVEPGFRPFC